MGEFVGKRVVPDHVGVWDQKKTYEPLMIVLDGETGDSYISRKAVPVGVSLADESYWSLCAHYSAQMRKLEQDVDVDVQHMAIGRPRTVKLSLNRTKLPLCG